MALTRKQRRMKGRAPKAPRTTESQAATLPPPRLYKYLSAERLTSLLASGRIRYTQPGDLNDPFEIRPIVTRIASKDEMHQYFRKEAGRDLGGMLGSHLSQHQLDALVAGFLEHAMPELEPFLNRAAGAIAEVVNNQMLPEGANKVVGVMSLSETCVSSLMWAHYAGSYQGVCLELNTASDFFKLPTGVHEDFGKLRRVLYSQSRPQFDFAGEGSVSLDFLYTKPPEWSYELEWRQLRPLSGAEQVLERSPFDIHLFPVPPGAISAVVLGFRVTRATFDAISHAIEVEPFLKGAALKAVVPRIDSFGLDIVEVKDWSDLQVDRSRTAVAKEEVLRALAESNAHADKVGSDVARAVLAKLIQRPPAST